MNDTTENQPSVFETKIVEFAANVDLFTASPRKINSQEKARLKQLQDQLAKLDLRTESESNPPVKPFLPGQTISPIPVPKTGQ